MHRNNRKVKGTRAFLLGDTRVMRPPLEIDNNWEASGPSSEDRLGYLQMEIGHGLAEEGSPSLL